MAAKKTYHIITIGCQMNKADSERLAGRLEQTGYKKIDNKYQADLVVVNTCGVRQTAEDRIYGLIPEIKKANKKCQVILTGCLAGRDGVQKRLKEVVDVWLPIADIKNYKFQSQNLNSKIKSKPRIPNKINFKLSDYLSIKPKYNSKFSAFVPIGNGCDNFCSYCVVPYARGREVYRPIEDVVMEARRLVEDGYKEIILIAQNVNSYKSQIQNPKSQTNSKLKIRNTKYKKVDFADLLKMVNEIPGDFWIKFSTSHPKDMSDKLIKTIASSKKICSYVHLPAQAGDDGILRKMNRKYKHEDYVKLVEKIRKQLNPPMAITTDIIVGFPGETKKQFNNTVRLMKQIKFDMAYIARYSPRPETAAFKLNDNVSKEEKERRETELMRILRKTALENNKKYLGKIVKVLIKGKNKRNELFGSTETSKAVKILAGGSGDLAGKFVNIKITKARDFGLAGEIA